MADVDDPAGHRCSTTNPEATQPGCGDMLLVSRADIEEVRSALLYICGAGSPTVKTNTKFQEGASARFFAAHEKLSAILKASSPTERVGLGERLNTDRSISRPNSSKGSRTTEEET